MSLVVSRSPVTDEPVASEVESTAAAVTHAADLARIAQLSWADLPLEKRLIPLRNLRTLLAERTEEIAEILGSELGRPLQESLGAEILPTLKHIDFLLKQAPVLLGVRRISRGSSEMPVPVGTAAVIGTWNYPLFLNLVPVLQAAVAGCSVLFKPSEHSVGTGQFMSKLITDAGFPEDLISVLYGGGEVGRMVVNADIDKLYFTGGSDTGRRILAELAQRGIPSVMELSGCDGMIVCADANVELAARTAVWARICNGGQSCVSPQRVYVVESVYDKFLASAITAIDAIDREDLTPLRTAAMREKVAGVLRDSVDLGARVVRGGTVDRSRPGWFFEPTLLADCTEEMPIMAQDLFAPVLAVAAVSTAEEAVRKINTHRFGLAASVWSRSRTTGAQIAAKVKVGLVSVNELLLDAADPAVSFGGMRSSGFGKQRGARGLDEFVVWKAVRIHRPDGVRRHLFPYQPAAADLLRSLVHLKSPGGIKALPGLIRAALQWEQQNRDSSAGTTQTGKVSVNRERKAS